MSENKIDQDNSNIVAINGKDETAKRRKNIFLDIKSGLKEVTDLEMAKKSEVRPESNQQRNLDRETGGLEVEENPIISEKDVWDNRGEEIADMIQDVGDLNNATKSSREQSFIHSGKQKKLKESRGSDLEASLATKGHVAKLMKWRQNSEDSVGRDGGGRVI